MTSDTPDPKSDDPFERMFASRRDEAKANAEASAQLAKMQANSTRRILDSRTKNAAELAETRLDSWKKPY